MENSRKSYESATQQLVSFLEHVTTMLQATSPSQRKLFEATKAQVLKTTGKNYKHRFSLGHGSNSSQLGDSIFRAESMPGTLINHGQKSVLLDVSSPSRILSYAKPFAIISTKDSYLKGFKHSIFFFSFSNYRFLLPNHSV